MSKGSEAVKRWRSKTKERIISAMGGGCVICGYNRCSSALALHHLDSTQKDFGLSSIRSNPKNWKAIVAEIKKCILVCHNCHMEIHTGMIDTTNIHNNFDSQYEDYSLLIQHLSDECSPCQRCAKLKPQQFIYCSRQCTVLARHGKLSL